MTGMTLARTDREIDQLRDLTLCMGGLAEASLALGLRAIWTRQQALCQQVVRDDVAIDRLDVAIDSAVLSLLARRAPVACDLRRVLAVKAIATDLERIDALEGDLIRESVARIQRAPETGEHRVDIIPIARSLEHVADHTVRLAGEVLRLRGSANLTLLETRDDP